MQGMHGLSFLIFGFCSKASFLTKITFQKRVFVFDDIFHPVW